MDNKIKEYFNGLAEILSSESNVFGYMVKHKGLVGSNREELFYNFLLNHLGSAFDCYKNVQIINSKGQLSREIDIVVANKLTMTLNTQRTSVVPVESVIAVFSIKSMLDKSQLIDSFELFKSIPEFSENVLQINDPLKYVEFDKHFPVCFVIAFKSIDGNTLLTHCNEYITKNPNYKISSFDSVCVINEFDINYVHCIGKQRYDIKGNPVKSNQFFLGRVKKEISGIALIGILTRVSRYSTWLPFINIDMHEYYKFAYEQFID